MSCLGCHCSASLPLRDRTHRPSVSRRHGAVNGSDLTEAPGCDLVLAGCLDERRVAATLSSLRRRLIFVAASFHFTALISKACNAALTLSQSNRTHLGEIRSTGILPAFTSDSTPRTFSFRRGANCCFVSNFSAAIFLAYKVCVCASASICCNFPKILLPCMLHAQTTKGKKPDS